jgi:hypothetical protein
MVATLSKWLTHEPVDGQVRSGPAPAARTGAELTPGHRQRGPDGRSSIPAPRCGPSPRSACGRRPTKPATGYHQAPSRATDRLRLSDRQWLPASAALGPGAHGRSSGSGCASGEYRLRAECRRVRRPDRCGPGAGGRVPAGASQPDRGRGSSSRVSGWPGREGRKLSNPGQVSQPGCEGRPGPAAGVDRDRCRCQHGQLAPGRAPTATVEMPRAAHIRRVAVSTGVRS